MYTLPVKSLSPNLVFGTNKYFYAIFFCTSDVNFVSNRSVIVSRHNVRLVRHNLRIFLNRSYPKITTETIPD